MFGSGRVVGQVLNLAFLPLILRFVSPTEFGAFVFLQTVALVWGVLMSLGLPAAFVSRYARAANQAGDGPRLLGASVAQQFIFGSALFGVGLGLLPVVGPRLAPDVSLLPLALLLAAELVANHVLLVARWQVMTGRHGQTSVVSVVRSVTFIVVALPLVSFAQLGLVGLAVADLASDIAAAVVCVIGTRGHVRLQLRREDLRATVSLGVPAMPDTIFFWVTVSAPLFFLRRGDLIAEAGVFALAWRLASVVDLLGNSFAVGSAGELLRSGATTSAKQLFRNTMSLVALAGLALSAFSPEAIYWFFPSGMTSAVAAIPFACLGAYFLSAYYFEWVGLSGSRRTIGLTLAAAGGAITSVGAFWLLPVSNAWQAAGLYALSMLAMWLVARWLQANIRFGNAPAILIGGLAATATGLMLQGFPLAPLGLAGKLAIVSAITAIVFLRARTASQ